jgi:hypothetical protein
MSFTVLDGASPHSILFPSSPIFHLPSRVFGCVCYVHNLGPSFDKLDPYSIKCLLGYSRAQKGYNATLQSCSAALKVLMLPLLSFNHISLKLVHLRNIKSSLLHLLSLFRLRVPSLPHLFLYLSTCHAFDSSNFVTSKCQTSTTNNSNAPSIILTIYRSSLIY